MSPGGRRAGLLFAATLLAGGSCTEPEAPGPPPARPLRPYGLIPPRQPAPGEAERPRAEPSAPALPEPSIDEQGGDGRLHVYFFDVGQGDAALVVSPSGRTLLIDAGPAEAGSYLSKRLPELVQGPIDLVVLTHPHSDHLGGMFAAVRATGASRFLDSGLRCDDPACPSLFSFLKAAGTQVVLPAPDPAAPGAPLRIGLGGGAELTVFWPRAPVEALLASGDLDANSLVARVEFGTTAVLFAGDARVETEKYLLRKKLDFRATLLKVGAHGADRATSAAFLEAVRPSAAIVSAGPGNTLKAPAKQTLGRLEQAGARVFRTDLDGEIDAVSDGAHFLVTTERPAAGEEPGTIHPFPPAPPAATPAKVSAPAPAQPRAAASAPGSAPAGRSPGGYGHVIDLDGKPATFEPARPVSSAKEVASTKDPAPGSGPPRYVASRSGKVFHMADCAAARRIVAKNLIAFRSRAEAAKNKRPAEDCNP